MGLPVRLAWLLLVSLVACQRPYEQPRPRATVPPLVEPTAFRIETVLFEAPLAVAEALYRPALEDDDTIAVLIDETHTLGVLEERARSDRAVIRAVRPDLTVDPGRPARIPERVPSSEIAARALASDFLALDIGATFSVDWAPVDLDVAIDWSERSGAGVVRLLGSRTPLAKDHWMMIVCLPARERAAADPATRALFAFVRAIALKDGGPLPERVF